MKEHITNTFPIQEQTGLTAMAWRKAWAKWGAKDPELHELSARIMQHSTAVREQHYTAHEESDLARLGNKVRGRIMAHEDSEDPDTHKDNDHEKDTESSEDSESGTESKHDLEPQSVQQAKRLPPSIKLSGKCAC